MASKEESKGQNKKGPGNSGEESMKGNKHMKTIGWRLFLILLFFNMLVCACSGRVGWMLFWAIAFSSCAHEYGYEYGK